MQSSIEYDCQTATRLGVKLGAPTRSCISAEATRDTSPQWLHDATHAWGVRHNSVTRLECDRLHDGEKSVRAAEMQHRAVASPEGSRLASCTMLRFGTFTNERVKKYGLALVMLLRSSFSEPDPACPAGLDGTNVIQHHLSNIASCTDSRCRPGFVDEYSIATCIVTKVC